MSFCSRLVVTCIVGAFALAPVWSLPAFSPHAPTLAPVSAPAPGAGDRAALRLLPLPLVGAIKIKDVGAIAAKFVARASSASTEYATGVQGAGQDWQSNASQSEANYEAGVQQGIAQKRFGKGVSDPAAQQKYVENATKLGPQRYQTGVTQAQGAYARGAGKHLDLMRNLTLPPRGPKGSPQNMQRAQVVAMANRALKTGQAA